MYLSLGSQIFRQNVACIVLHVIAIYTVLNCLTSLTRGEQYLLVRNTWLTDNFRQQQGYTIHDAGREQMDNLAPWP